MNATAEQTAMLAAIVADPDDDAPRLGYADWLDEHAGEGTVLPTPRAEFIRVQVELARQAACGVVVPEVDLSWKCECEVCTLSRRVATLLDANRAEWLRGPKCEKCGGSGRGEHVTRFTVEKCPTCHGTGDAGGLTWRLFLEDPESGLSPVDVRQPTHVTFRRGFPQVEVPRLVDAIHEPHYNAGHDTESYGHLQPTSWLAAVVAAHPVTEVVALDREPRFMRGAGNRRDGFLWFGASEGRMREELPTAIFNRLEGYTNRHRLFDSLLGNWVSFDTRELAVTALARAIVQFARNPKGSNATCAT